MTPGAFNSMKVLGIDIGGANIKAADEAGRALSRPFAIWKYPDRLNEEFAAILSVFPDTDEIVLTLTAELADCFSSKREGVEFVIDAVEAAYHLALSHNQKSNLNLNSTRAWVWTTDGRFVSSREAKDFPLKVAAANWHALATWCVDFVQSTDLGLLIDIGSTTTDIIPLTTGKAVPVGLTDVTRLQSGELSYSGVWRTPLCAVAHSVPFRDGYCSLAAELFATTLDIYLLLDQIGEDPTNTDTANGKPATKPAAYDRLARMLCCDRHEFSYDEAVEVARFLADVQRQRLAGSLERVLRRMPGRCQTVILSGSGDFLARQLVDENRLTNDSHRIVLAERFSPEVAEASCAYALTQLKINRA